MDARSGKRSKAVDIERRESERDAKGAFPRALCSDLNRLLSFLPPFLSHHALVNMLKHPPHMQPYVLMDPQPNARPSSAVAISRRFFSLTRRRAEVYFVILRSVMSGNGNSEA